MLAFSRRFALSYPSMGTARDITTQVRKRSCLRPRSSLEYRRQRDSQQRTGEQSVSEKSNQRRHTIVFVGGFQQAAGDGAVGGQIFACRSLIESPLKDSYEWHLIDTTQRSQPPPGIVIRSIDAARRLLRFTAAVVTGKADAVLIFTTYGALGFLEKGCMVLLARMSATHVVLTIRSEIRPLPSDRWLLGFRRLVVRRCSALICQGPTAKQSALSHLECSPGKATVIKNWINVAAYRPLATQRDWQRAASTLLFLGYLESFKGIAELIEACSILKQKGCKFRLLVCGDGSLRTHLENQIATHDLENHVELRGWCNQQEKFAALGESGILVLPSYSEGIPNAVLEGMSSGCAIVATRVGGVPDLVESEAQGLLIPPRRVEQLVDALESLLSAPEQVQRMGAENLRIATENHDSEHVWTKVRDVIAR